MEQRPTSKRDDEGTAAIFARVPRAEADKLERLSFELKRPKQEIIAGLLARYEGPESESEPAAPSLPSALALGRYGFRPADVGEVLTLEQLAAFLQVERGTAEALAEAGEIPGRKIADEWRFSKDAVLAWLKGESQ